MYFDLDPNDSDRTIRRFATYVALAVLVLVGLAATGCAHLPGAPAEAPTCDQLLEATARECQFAGSEVTLTADGVGFAFTFVCPAGQPPTIRMIGVSDSPTMLAGARESGARDGGTCTRGEHEYSVVVFEREARDLRAGGAK